MNKIITEISKEDAFDFGVMEGKKEALKDLLEFTTPNTFMDALIKSKLKDLESKTTLERTLRGEKTSSRSKI